MKNNLIYLLVIMVCMACKKTESVTPTPVTPSPVLSDAKEITSFSFAKANNSNLAGDIVATIDATNHTITATLPTGTAVTALKASFSISANANLKVGTTIQTSAGTANDFTNPVTFTVTAQNNTTQNYIATIKVETATNTSSNLVIKREEFAPGPPVQTIPTQTVNYTYNSSGQLISFKDIGGNYTFEYDANGLLKTQIIKDNNGNVTNTLTYSLNTAKQVIIVAGTYGQTLENFTYGTSGELTKYTKSYYGAVKDTYEYTNDSKGRVKTAKYVSANDAAGTYTLYNYEYYDNIFDPDPMIKVFIRPAILYGIEPSTQKAYALKAYSYQKYDLNGVIGSNPNYQYAYTTNTDGFITALSDGNGGALYKFTFK